MAARFDAGQQTLGLQIGDDGLARFEAIEADVLGRRFRRDLRVETDHAGHGQAVSRADLVIERIVCRRHLDRARAEIAFDRGIGDDRNVRPERGSETSLPTRCA